MPKAIIYSLVNHLNLKAPLRSRGRDNESVSLLTVHCSLFTSKHDEPGKDKRSKPGSRMRQLGSNASVRKSSPRRGTDEKLAIPNSVTDYNGIRLPSPVLIS